MQPRNHPLLLTLIALLWVLSVQAPVQASHAPAAVSARQALSLGDACQATAPCAADRGCYHPAYISSCLRGRNLRSTQFVQGFPVRPRDPPG
jgi:hypothetical protein